MKAYLTNLAVSLSQLLNTLRGGHPDFTLSASAYVAAIEGNARAQFAVRWLDRIFFWDYAHCASSWQRDVTHASHVLRKQADIRRSLGA